MVRLLTLSILFVSASPAWAQAPAASPSKLSLYIGGFTGPSFSVELVPDSSSVRYRYNPDTCTSAEGTKEEKLEIPKERWLAFWKRLEEAKVWNWETNYAPPQNIADGTVWMVSLEWSGRKVSSSGSNAYPEAKQFEIFKAAVSELLGGRKFE